MYVSLLDIILIKDLHATVPLNTVKPSFKSLDIILIKDLHFVDTLWIGKHSRLDIILIKDLHQE